MKKLIYYFAALLCSATSNPLALAQQESLVGFNVSVVADQTANLANKDIIDVVLLTDENLPPFSYIEDGELKGLWVDMIAAIDKKLPKYRITLRHMQWKKAKVAMRNGEYFGLLGAYFHGHDWPYLYPYSQPLMYDNLVTVCSSKANMPAQSSWPENYSGLTLGTISSYDGWADFGRQLRNEKIAYFFEYPNIELVFKSLLQARIDCFLVEPSTYHEQLRLAQQKQIVPDGFDAKITNVLSKNSVHLGYSMPAIKANKYPFAIDFQRAFDSQLFLLKQQNAFAPLFKKHGVPVVQP